MEENYKEEMEALWRVSWLISTAQEPKEVILGIIKEATKILKADAASIRLLEKENLTVMEGYQLSEEYRVKVPHLRVGEGIAGRVAQSREPLFSEDVEKDPRILCPEAAKKEGIVSLICAPISATDKLLGALTIYSKKSRAWTKREVRILSVLAEQTAFILEKIRSFDALKERSIRDELTGLYSRSYFLARAKEEIARSSREGNSLSFLFCDINNFKAINQIQGYAQGDKILCQVAKVIKSSLRKGDTVCRYGGDEFVVLLPRTDPLRAEKIAKRICQTCTEIKDHPFLSVSIGIASYPAHGKFIEDILAKADRSMVFAKYHSEKRAFVWDEWEIEDTEKLYKEEVLPELIYALAEIVNLKDGYTGEHSRLVSEQALLFAQKIGLKEERTKKIKIAALLHDIGKITIPTHILNKPAPLTQKEMKIVKKHAEDGVKIMRYIKGLNKIIPIVRAIHERWDGKGYPDGLAGEQIPLEARIIALADTYQTLSTNRPYRERFSKEEVTKRLRDGAGKQFDPKLTQTFLEFLS